MEINESLWPSGLKLVKPRIKKLHYKGNPDLLTSISPKLAVVGSRRMTGYGEGVIKSWVGVLARRGVIVVSGFMYGVDQAAHEACIENGGKTIAVLGWGIERKVSAMDEKLYWKILERDGLILSEYPGMVGAEKWTFPQRNRIVVGVSDAVWVVEGAMDSGSMITARLGKTQKKPVLALPGQVGMKVTEGVNNLIKKGDAVMTTGVEDLFLALKMERRQQNIVVGMTNDPIMAALESGPKTADEMLKILKISADQLMKKLSMMCLESDVEEVEGRYRKVR